MSAFTFPVGYRAFHENQLFNYQLNRWYSLGYARLEDMEHAGRRIGTFEDWKTDTMRSSGTRCPGSVSRWEDGSASARSVTGRIFTKEEHAQNHCQVGNIGLAPEVMIKWIDAVSLSFPPLSQSDRIGR